MKKKASVLVCVIGLVLLLIGVFMPVPGKLLTTYDSLDGKSSDYSDEKYNAIEEYVGGDAYNYIVGAALEGGEIAGVRSQKAIFITGGLIIISLGVLSYVYLCEEAEKELENLMSNKKLTETTKDNESKVIQEIVPENNQETLDVVLQNNSVE